MKKAVLLLNALFVFLALGHAQTSADSKTTAPDLPQTQIMKVDDVRPGMKGIGYTVFEGTKPEPMGVEVLGVLRNLNGPKSDVVLVRLKGEKAEEHSSIRRGHLRPAVRRGQDQHSRCDRRKSRPELCAVSPADRRSVRLQRIQ